MKIVLCQQVLCVSPCMHKHVHLAQLSVAFTLLRLQTSHIQQYCRCPVVWGSVAVYDVYPPQSCMQMIGLYKSRNMEDSELTANFTSGGTRPSAVATSQSAENEVVLRLHQRVNELEDKLALYEVMSLCLSVCVHINMHTYIHLYI